MLAVRDLTAFATVLEAKGAVAALQYLNQGVPHRYSAIYRFAGPLLRNVHLHDKLGEVRPEYLVAVPFEQSFCQFVLRDRAFQTDDSGADPRLVGHPYRGVVVSYHSVPVVTERGDLWGTLCHFDTRALSISDEEFELLQGAARVLPRFLCE